MNGHSGAVLGADPNHHRPTRLGTENAGIAEDSGVEMRWRPVQQNAVVRGGPCSKLFVRERHGDSAEVDVAGQHARVHDDRPAAIDNRGSRPAPLLARRGSQCDRQPSPLHQIGADRMPPLHDRSPGGTGRNVLEEKVILAVDPDNAVRIVEPAALGCEVQPRADSRGNFRRRRHLDRRRSIGCKRPLGAIGRVRHVIGGEVPALVSTSARSNRTGRSSWS